MVDTLTRDEALRKFSRLYELLESEEDSEEYPGGEEEMEDELSEGGGMRPRFVLIWVLWITASYE